MRRLQKTGTRGFTLVELIVVIGLMGLLATISIGGYFAAARGMAARGVVQDTASLVRQAMQTCLIDQVPTAVLFLNRRNNTKSEGGEAYGTAIAIKMAGRISYVAQSGGKTSQGDSISVGGGALLIDEFADWNQSYSVDASDKPAQRSVRLYRMFSGKDGIDSLGKGLKNCSSLMCAWVGYKEFDQDFMITDGRKVVDWCSDNKKEYKDNSSFSGIGYRNANSFRWGLPFHPDNGSYLKASDWRIGDAYGIEIAQLDLPKNYIFGSRVPTGTELEPASSPSDGVLVFTPGMVKSSSQYEFNVNQVEISILNDIEGTDTKVIGAIDKSMFKDQD